MSRYKDILLVDDHGITREGAALYLRAVDPEINIRHAKSPEEAMAQIEAAKPDLIFLDLRFEDDGKGGLRLLNQLKKSDSHDAIPVIIMSGETLNKAAIDFLLEQGAAGFLSKGSEGGEVFKAALMAMEAGGVYIHGARPSGSTSYIDLKTSAAFKLRPSYERVLARHVKGMPYKRIADQCDIAEQTVKESIGEMCKIFKVPNAKALIYEIARAGVALSED